VKKLEWIFVILAHYADGRSFWVYA